MRLSDEEADWLEIRMKARGFSSKSDCVRDIFETLRRLEGPTGIQEVIKKISRDEASLRRDKEVAIEQWEDRLLRIEQNKIIVERYTLAMKREHEEKVRVEEKQRQKLEREKNLLDLLTSVKGFMEDMWNINYLDDATRGGKHLAAVNLSLDAFLELRDRHFERPQAQVPHPPHILDTTIET